MLITGGTNYVGPAWPGKGPYQLERFPPPSKQVNAGGWTFTLSGTLVDINSNPIVGSTIWIFRMDTLVLVAQTITSAGGIWSAIVPTNSVTYLVVSYIVTSAIVAGVSAGTLSPIET